MQPVHLEIVLAHEQRLQRGQRGILVRPLVARQMPEHAAAAAVLSPVGSIGPTGRLSPAEVSMWPSGARSVAASAAVEP